MPGRPHRGARSRKKRLRREQGKKAPNIVIHTFGDEDRAPKYRDNYNSPLSERTRARRRATGQHFFGD